MSDKLKVFERPPLSPEDIQFTCDVVDAIRVRWPDAQIPHEFDVRQQDLSLTAEGLFNVGVSNKNPTVKVKVEVEVYYP